MSTIPAPTSEKTSPKERLEALFGELSELAGQRNAIDGRIVDIVAEIDHDELWGATGCRSIAALVAWKTGVSPGNADALATVAHRSREFPRCTQRLREGRLSLDQVAVIAQRAGQGSDAHYVQLASVATVSQLRTAIKLEPPPDPGPGPKPEPARSIVKTSGAQSSCWRITLPPTDAAIFDAALRSHLDALITDWKHHHTSDADGDADSDSDSEDDGAGGAGHPGARPPMPTQIDAFLRLIETGWDTEATRRPHGQHTTVVLHVDVKDKIAALHLGPFLTPSERQYLTCDATCEVWFERGGRVIGCGRTARTVGRRLRRVLEHRDRCCVVPGCGAIRGLHAHHIRHWEDGGATDLNNLVLLCPYHHRLHHHGLITITGPPDRLVVTDSNGQPLHPGSLARPPSSPPPDVGPYPGPTGEKADWWWYQPFQPQPPPNLN